MELPGVVEEPPGVVEEPPGVVEEPPGVVLSGMEEGLPVFIVSEGELLLLPLGVSMLPPDGGVLIPPEGLELGVVVESGVMLPALVFLALAGAFFFFLVGVGVD
jgi:hypothetical protein